MHSQNGYGWWSLVIINSVIFIFFAFSFYHPKTKRDWRSFGAFSAFIIALFTEMYGFPLTIYILSGWLESRFPKISLFSHETGHLWSTIFGWKRDPHLDPLHILSIIFILVGFVILAKAWRVLYQAQKAHMLATQGIYSKMRHPQYLAFIVIMIGFLLQWPTLLTLIMFPILIWFYVRLAKKEERDAVQEFGDAYRSYMRKTPGFLPTDRRNR